MSNRGIRDFWPSKRDGRAEAEPKDALLRADVQRLRNALAEVAELAEDLAARTATLQGMLAEIEQRAEPATSPEPEDAVPARGAEGSAPAAGRATGTVRWFNPEKGFGFIEPDAGGPDLFAHYTQIDVPGFRELVDGQRVEFDVADGEKGPQADDIRVL